MSESSEAAVEQQEYYDPPLEFEEVEDFRKYNQGGFHPVDIGDLLNGRFEVVHKLGCGGFGIVWLCLDRDLNKWRAVKILTADHSGRGTNREMRVLRHLHDQSSREELEKNHIVFPLEHFYVSGPNGRHLCFVLPVCGCRVSTWCLYQDSEKGSTAAASRDICRQLAKGIRFLHGKGIVHADIRPANILMRLKGIDDLTRDQMNELLGEPETVPIETISGSDPHPRAPQFCVKNVGEYWCESLLTPEVAIIDFGESFHAQSSRGSWGIPFTYAAPEILFPKTVEATGFDSDVWALACTMFEIKTGKSLFHAGSSLRSLVRDFELLLGPLPEPYRSAWNAPEQQGPGGSVATGGSKLGDEDTVSGSTYPTAWEPASLLKRKAEILAGTGCADVLEGKLLQERILAASAWAPYVGSKLDSSQQYKKNQSAMTSYSLSHYRPPSGGIVWVKSMKLGKGTKHTPAIWQRIQNSERSTGDGTPQNPSVCWLKEPPEDEIAEATEQLVREEAVKFRCGITDIWLLMDGHSRTTAGHTADGRRDMVNDDCHMTVRMGTAHDTENLHGHLYFVTDDGTDTGRPVRIMTDDERTWVGASARMLWIWGPYPKEDLSPNNYWPRAGFSHPRPPFTAKPGRKAGQK
ncbi:hypothetical protein DL768_004830 [Monosporascus sp. mg162]|nr:hypothetical protein DL768_004830 [Monosporascus sp. mg162]